MTSEGVWMFATLGALLGALLIFRRFRRRTASFAAARAAKSRLPSWVAAIEQLTWLALTILIGAGVFGAFLSVERATGVAGHLVGAAAVFAILGVGLIALPLAMLVANGISWLVPPLRAANLRAMAGTQISFRSANRGLLMAAFVTLPLGLVFLSVAALQPWSH